MCKKIITPLVVTICFIYMVCSLSVAVSAASSISFSFPEINAYAGDTISIPVSLNSSSGFVSVSLLVEYDSSVLTLISVKDTGLIDGQMHTTNYSSPYTLTWENDEATSNNNVDGAIAYLVFDVSKYAEPGEYSIGINAPEDGIIDANGNVVDCSFISGSVTVMAEECSHSWSTWKRSSSSKHKRSCNLCGETEYDYHEYDDGEVTEEPTEDSTGVLTYTCDTCGATKTEIIPVLEPDEYDISGTVTSYGDADEAVTVILYDAAGSKIDSDTTTDGTYTLSAPDGIYTLRVSKANHVTRDYTVEVSGGTVTQNVKIHPLGDVNGDGVVNGNDIQRIYAHITGSSPITDSAMLKRANVNGDSVINGNDIQRIYAHITGANLLF